MLTASESSFLLVLQRHIQIQITRTTRSTGTDTDATPRLTLVRFVAELVFLIALQIDFASGIQMPTSPCSRRPWYLPSVTSLAASTFRLPPDLIEPALPVLLLLFAFVHADIEATAAGIFTASGFQFDTGTEPRRLSRVAAAGALRRIQYHIACGFQRYIVTGMPHPHPCRRISPWVVVIFKLAAGIERTRHCRCCCCRFFIGSSQLWKPALISPCGPNLAPPSVPALAATPAPTLIEASTSREVLLVLVLQVLHRLEINTGSSQFGIAAHHYVGGFQRGFTAGSWI